MSQRILVCCALKDDAAVGAGGTIAKYAKEGKEVRVIVFSYGELGQGYLKPELVRKFHIKEAKEANEILGGQGVLFLGLREGKFVQEAVQPPMRKRLKNLLEEYRPHKIFLHAADDPQPGHRAVHKIMRSLVKAMNLNCEMYSFDVWSPVSFKHRNEPKLVVDISKVFDKKLAALNAHKSQHRLVVGPLLRLKTIIKDWFNGLKHGCKYAEVFVKLR